MKRKSLLFIVLTVLVMLVVVSCLTACDKADETIDIIDTIGGNGDTTLTDPTNIKYDGDAITWDAVSNATHYFVSINGGEARKVASPMYIYNALGQSFSVKVTAANEGGAKDVTVSFNPLDPVTEINLDPAGFIYWTDVRYATGYEIKVDNAKDTTIVSAPRLQISTVGTHSYSVKPIIQGDPSYFSTFSNGKRVTLLDKVDVNNITYSEGYINWKYVSGASLYEVSINGVTYGDPVSATKVFYNPNNADFDVTVKALGDNTQTLGGATSDTKSFVFMETVTNIHLEDGVLRWDAVDKATGYKIKLNGREIAQTLTDTSFANITEGVSTTVQVMGTSNLTTVFSSWSEEQAVYLLPAPVLRWNSAYATTEDQTESIFWDWTMSQAVAGFNVKVIDPDGRESITSLPSSQRSYTNEYRKPGDYVITIQADTNEAGFFASRYSKSITVNRLAAPERASNFIVSDNANINNGFTITIKQDASASRYYLYRDGNKVDETTTASFVQKGFHDPDAIDTQVFDYKVIAKGANTLVNGRVVIDSLYSDALSFSVTMLATPNVNDMSGFRYSFTAVSGSTGYRVNVGSNKFDPTETYQDLSSIESGTYEVNVCAKGDGQFILPSNPAPSLYVNRLDAPTHIRIDTSEASEGIITYDRVQYASGYTITFNNDGNAIPADTIENINQYITQAGTTVVMTSTANYYNDIHTIYYMTSKSSPTMNFIKLAAPTFGNVAFTDSELIWNAPSNVDTNVYTPQYLVYYGDGTIYNGQRTGTRMDISHLEGGNTYDFRVKAIGDGSKYINSDKSTTVTITKLRTPTVTTTDTAYSWKKVASAQNYVVYVDGKLVDAQIHDAGENTYEYVPNTFTEIKEYTVQVYAIGDGGYTTIRSDAATVVTPVIQLATPDFTFSYDKDSYQADGKITVTLIQGLEYASGYTYTIAGVTRFSEETSYSHCPGSAGTYDMRVYANGGMFDEDGNYYFDSQSVGGNSRYRITLLPSPNPSEMELSRDGVITWKAINNNVGGYHVMISKDGDEIVNTDCTTAIYEFNDFDLSVSHTYSIQLYVKGNGTTVIQSETVEKEWTVNP